MIILLHGFRANGFLQDTILGFSGLGHERAIHRARPDGTLDPEDQRFWNGTPNCCDRFDSGVDDEGYIRALIAEAQANYRIDPGRVYLFGHSNGGFLSYRMACGSPDVVTAIASLAGSTFEDPADCEAETPVSVLQIHGTNDIAIRYEGDDRGRHRLPIRSGDGAPLR